MNTHEDYLEIVRKAEDKSFFSLHNISPISRYIYVFAGGILYGILISYLT